MSFFVYVIRSRKHQYTYVGMTNNLHRRLMQHNRKQARSTRPYASFDLLHSEKFPNRFAARQREKYLKSGVGREFINSIVKR